MTDSIYWKCATPVNSTLSQHFEQQGMSVLHLGLQTRCDMTRTRGREKVVETVRERRPRLVWLNPVDNVFNLETARAADEISRMQLYKAKAFMRNTVQVMEEALHIGSMVVAVEPRSCRNWTESS